VIVKAASSRLLRAALLAAAVAALTLPDPQRAPADSLWSRRERHDAFLFEDNRARQVGDLLTVAINENSTIGNNEQATLDKTATFANAFSFKGDSSSGSTSLKGAADLTLNGSANRSMNGQAQLNSTRVYTDFMAVMVIDKLPNGNLVIEGHRTRFVAGEERTIRLTGTVRPADIGFQNTVQSQFIANFQISYVGKGPDTTFTHYGWFGKAMNLIWPF
jgi:flagellar L-ring protein precursor FlgH